MLGVLSDNRLKLFRRNDAGKTEEWLEVYGDGAVIGRALAAARELEAEASAMGGWSHADRLSMDPQKPRQSGQVEAVVLGLNRANSSLGKLKIAGRTDRPGPVRVRVDRRRLSVVPVGNGTDR